ncbi:MAG: nitroreductase family protein [bacterium]
MKTTNNRSTEYPINDIFLQRYSSRAMSGETISKEEIMTLFEAARWSPSSMNAQPWRFVYAMCGTPEFAKLFSFIMDKNQVWAKNSSALILLVSKNNLDDGSFSVPHSFDAGAAWENLALQSTSMKFVSHAIGGFDKKLAKESLEIYDDYTIEIMIAIGKPGKIEDLPEALQVREKPSQRKNLDEIVFEGNFKN